MTQNGNNTINMNNSQGIYSFHRGGANAVFCDGAVHFLGVGLTPQVLAPSSPRGAAVLIRRKSVLPNHLVEANSRLLSNSLQTRQHKDQNS